jgi:homoserine dehydrogenase
LKKRYKILLIGLGNVGQSFVSLLYNKERFLSDNYGFKFKFVGVSNLTNGCMVDKNGIDPAKLLTAKKGLGRNFKGAEFMTEYSLGNHPGLSPCDMIEENESDFVVEATRTNLKNAEPAFTYIKKALTSGRDVVTANKGPVALHYRELEELARETKTHFRFESTVLSGTPAISLGRECLAGSSFSRVRGIVNGTTNFILTEMEKGKSFNQSLEEAQLKGFAEHDPTEDVQGLDSAAKICILANSLMDAGVTLNDVSFEGIDDHELMDKIESAKNEGKRVKLIAEAEKGGKSSKNGVSAYVKKENVPPSDPLSHVDGVLNAITFSSDIQPDVTVMGPGAGGNSAAFGILSDLLAIHRLRTSKFVQLVSSRDS